MRYFFDTEFIEKPCTIDLISIGIVSDDGRMLHEVSSEFDPTAATPWVRDNVIAHLPTTIVVPRRTRTEIRDRIVSFIGDDANPRFWAYFADYDWVNFCWLFGRMMELPKRFPKFCLDLKQTMAELRIHRDELPEDPMGVHDALEDAMWLRSAFALVRERAHRLGVELP